VAARGKGEVSTHSRAAGEMGGGSRVGEGHVPAWHTLRLQAAVEPEDRGGQHKGWCQQMW
jgi:hypothetical protein